MKILDKPTRDLLALVFLLHSDIKDAIRTPYGVVSNHGSEVVIVNDENDRDRWANRPNVEWPVSELRTMPNGKLRIYLDGRNGDLIDIHGGGIHGTADIGGAEFDAYVEDVLFEAADIVTDREV